MNNQSVPPSSRIEAIKDALVSFLIIAVVVLFTYELFAPADYSLLVKGTEKLGEAWGRGQDKEIRASAKAQFAQEYALAQAQELAKQDTLN